MGGKKGVGATIRSATAALASRETILRALEDHGAMTAAEITERTKLARSTVKKNLERMRKDGLICMLGVKQMDVPANGKKPQLYGVGGQKYAEQAQGDAMTGGDDEPLHRGPAVVTIHRHPQDVALFGEYERRAA